MTKNKEQKRIERARVKERKRFKTNFKKVTEKHRLESKKAEAKATLDANMAAVEKTLDMFNTAYENEEKKKKKKPIVFILSAALVVSTAVAGVGLHFANRNNPNDVPLPPGHSDDLDATATPTDTTTPTPIVSVKPSDNAGDDKIDSTPVPDESEKVEDIYIPGVVVTPRPEQSSEPSQSSDPSQSINSDHIHTYGDWGYHDDKMEARMCTICGALEYRSHVIEEFITYDQSQKKDIHKIYTNYECINCGYKYTLSKEGYCEWRLERYDENLEYLKCRKCNDIKEQNHEFNVFEENGNLVYDCTHVECDYVKIESKGPDISFPVNPSPSPSNSVNPSQPVDPSPSPSESVNPSQPVDPSPSPSPSESVNPSQPVDPSPSPSDSVAPSQPVDPLPSEDPDRGEIDDGSGNPGIGNGGTKPGFGDDDIPSPEPSVEVSPSPEPSDSVAPSQPVDPLPSEDPDRGEIDDGSGNPGIGNGGTKPGFGDDDIPSPEPSVEVSPSPEPSDSDRNEITDENGNQGIGNGNVKPFDDEPEEEGTFEPEPDASVSLNPDPSASVSLILPDPTVSASLDPEPSKDADRDEIVSDKGHNPGIGSGSVKPFDDELEEETIKDDTEKIESLSSKIEMFKRVKRFLTFIKTDKEPSKIMKL